MEECNEKSGWPQIECLVDQLEGPTPSEKKWIINGLKKNQTGELTRWQFSGDKRKNKKVINDIKQLLN